MRVTGIASLGLLFMCTAVAAPPSVNHTGNYTVILTYGQTPYQIGYRAAGNIIGWNRRDSGTGMQQQNLILAMVPNETAHPVSGLSPPSFSPSQTGFRAGMNTYSWKADEDGVGNYSNDTDIWHRIDPKGRKSRLELKKDGIVLKSEVVPEGGISMYNTTIYDREGHAIRDVTVFQVGVAGVFRG